MVRRPAEDEVVRNAYAACSALARGHYENFPVASWLLPPRMRPHVAAVYAFARTADDFADEGDRSPQERLCLLDAWLDRLRAEAASGGTPRIDDPHTPIFVALRHSIGRCNLPLSLFEDLLDAFRQDVTVHRYATFDDLLDYCRRSANPVGRLVLRIAGHDRPALDGASDALCTALQLTNFWQDLVVDWKRGRLYLPAEDREAVGAREADLDAGRMTAEWRRALARMVERTRELFASGRPVADGVGGRLRFELRATWLGGCRILDRLEQAGFDVFSARPSLTRRDLPALAWGTLAWRQATRRAPANLRVVP
jgi:phytoene synthase